MKRFVTFMAAALLFSPMTVHAEDTYLSKEIQQYCIEIGEQYNICPELLEAMIEKESAGKADAKNGSCKGLMQVSTACHKSRMKRLGVTDIYDPYSNILVGADYLAELFAEHEDVGVVLGAYHGEKNYKTLVSSYTTWILERSAELEREHGK